MSTLYLRNVPDAVVRRLEQLAARERMSVSAMAIQELDRASRRADNPALFDGLPDVDVERDDIIAAIEQGRATR